MYGTLSNYLASTHSNLYPRVEEIPNEQTVWMNRRPLLRTQKCIDFGISRPLLRTKKYIDFGISQKCPFIRTHKYTDFGISRKCPLLRNLLYSCIWGNKFRIEKAEDRR